MAYTEAQVHILVIPGLHEWQYTGESGQEHTFWSHGPNSSWQPAL